MLSCLLLHENVWLRKFVLMIFCGRSDTELIIPPAKCRFKGVLCFVEGILFSACPSFHDSVNILGFR